MIHASAKGATCLHLLSAGSKADTAAATGTAVDITEYEGYLMVTQNTGTVTAGTIVGKLQHGDAADGSDAADVTGATFTSVGTTTDESSQVIAVPVSGLKKYLRYVGTVTTGPAVVGVTAVGVKKYV